LTIVYDIQYNDGEVKRMNKKEEIMDNLILELRRGTIVLSVLSQLKSPQYGYSLVQRLEEKEIFIDASTLYPLMRRLEIQDLLKSEWETSGNKPRKYYVISELGLEVLNELSREWETMSEKMKKMMKEEK